MAGPEVTLNCTLLPRKRIPVREVIVHENYRTDGQKDDIALLKLSEYLPMISTHQGGGCECYSKYIEENCFNHFLRNL